MSNDNMDIISDTTPKVADPSPYQEIVENPSMIRLTNT